MDGWVGMVDACDGMGSGERGGEVREVREDEENVRLLMRYVVSLGNIVIIGILVAGYVGYSAYRQKNQGGGITGGMKRS